MNGIWIRISWKLNGNPVRAFQLWPHILLFMMSCCIFREHVLGKKQNQNTQRCPANSIIKMAATCSYNLNGVMVYGWLPKNAAQETSIFSWQNATPPNMFANILWDRHSCEKLLCQNRHPSNWFKPSNHANHRIRFSKLGGDNPYHHSNHSNHFIQWLFDINLYKATDLPTFSPHLLTCRLPCWFTR